MWTLLQPQRIEIMLGILITAALLSLIMFAVARHEADYSFPKVALISLGLGLTNFAITIFAGGLPALIVMLGLMVWALHQFCYLRWGMAGLVTGIYLVCQIVISLVMGWLTR